MATKQLAIRRFAKYRADGKCFELYDAETGKCASFPGTKKELTVALQHINT